MELTLSVPRAWVMTANHRPHPMVRARLCKQLRNLAQWAVRAERPKAPARFPVRCVVTFTFPDTVRRDAANLAPTAKPLVDGLVDAGLIPDDSTKYLTGVDTRISRTHPSVTPRPGVIPVVIRFTQED